MRSRSSLRVLIYLAALALLGIQCGIFLFHQFTARPSLPVQARNVPPSLIDGEAKETEPPRGVHNAGDPLDGQNRWQVRSVFRVIDHDERQDKERRYLIRMGEKVFSTYEEILSDPRAEPLELANVFGLLLHVKGDPHCFLKQALFRFTDVNVVVRVAAVELLARIGSAAEASPVVALFSDEHTEVAYAAAKTLAVIGGPNEVVAMDVWLRGVSHREDRQLREHVQKCRDELKRRLEEARAKDPKK